MKISIIFLFLLCAQTLAQQSDTIFSTKILKCIYDTKLKYPRFIQYKLYKGGGDCDRSKFRFLSCDWTASNSDYINSGYDRGHLANAEDFASDCGKESLTFWYYNVVPQTHIFNAGIFKKHETLVRYDSQNDSLLIIYINTPSEDIIGRGVHKIKNTYKIVQSLSTKKILYCIRFTDEPNPKQEDCDIGTITKESGVGFDIKR